LIANFINQNVFFVWMSSIHFKTLDLFIN